MPNQDPKSRNTTNGALELNKETLQDLDLEPGDAANVKGGVLSIVSANTYKPVVQVTLTCAMHSTA